MQLPDESQLYTYADYCGWGDEERWELIDGIPFAMAPAPSTAHQSISSVLHGKLFAFLEGKPCKVFHAPFDVRLNSAGEDDTVVQPDIVVVCDTSKLDEKGCNGAPDMVIEILSPSTAKKDRVTKFNKYQQAGVREYWLVDPDSKTLSTHVLTDGGYITRAYGEEDSAYVSVLKGCEISMPDIFAE